VLVDTSVWVDHFRYRSTALVERLDKGEVLCHPFVIGELACGHLLRRGEILSLLDALPRTPLAEHDEVMSFVESRRLGGTGVGWIDAHLLASARLAGVGFWTVDRRLASAARRLGLAPGP